MKTEKASVKGEIIQVAIDFGGSQTKVVANRVVNGVQKCWRAFYVDPEVIEISELSARNLKKDWLLQQSQATQRAWIGINERYYALGSLASSQFAGLKIVKSLKIEAAPLKVLGALWMLKVMWNLKSQYRIKIFCLLPIDEYQSESIEDFKETLNQYLSAFETPDGTLSCKLEQFKCLPEGLGILGHYCHLKGKPWKQNTHTGIWMLGYRNTSLLLSYQGTVGLRKSSDLGFVVLVDRVTHQFPGQTREKLTPVLAQAGANLAEIELRKLFQGLSPQKQEKELTSLKAIVSRSVKDYAVLLRSWLTESLKGETLDLLLVAGGTADYLGEYLNDILQGYQWERPEDVVINQKLETIMTPNRMADVWSFFSCYLAQEF